MLQPRHQHHAAKYIFALIFALTSISLTGCDSSSDLDTSAQQVVTDSATASADETGEDAVGKKSNADTRKVKRGQYRYFADAATFTECNTGQKWPIAPSDEAAKLERAYLEETAKNDQAVQAVTVSMETHIEVIEGMEAGTSMPHLIVDRFIGIDPDQQCDITHANLVGTYWRLNRVASFDTMPEGLREEPRIILANDGNMKGHSGCNAMFGQYTQHDDTLKFNGIAGTRMACAKIMALESAFHLALRNTASYRIDGPYLYLETESGQALATLEAVYLY
jgi:copper homeostasis protein (lipoprotein)